MSQAHDPRKLGSRTGGPDSSSVDGAGGQTRGTPLLQTPAWQRSPVVHALPSVHDVPSGRGMLVHAPVCGSQTPAAWQASAAAQTTGAPLVQTPASQRSPLVQALPSV